MAKAKACSTSGIPAGVLSGYKRKRTPASKLKYINTQLDPSIPNTPAHKHLQLAEEINAQYPGYVDMGEELAFLGMQGKLFQDDKRPTAQANQTNEADAAEADATARAQKLVKKEKPVAKPKEKKTRRPKRSAKKVAAGEQPGGTEQTGGADTKPASSPAPKGKALKKGREQVTNPPEEAGENKPAEQTEPKQTKREEQQPSSLEDKAKAKRDREALDIEHQVETEELSTAAELAAAVEVIENSKGRGRAWMDAVYTIMDMALLAGVNRPKMTRVNKVDKNGKEIKETYTNKKGEKKTRSILDHYKDTESTLAYYEARGIVGLETIDDAGLARDEYVTPENYELLWGGVKLTPAKKILRDFIVNTVRADAVPEKGKVAVTFETHADLWQLASDLNMVQFIVRELAHPTKGKGSNAQRAKSVVPAMTSDMEYLMEEDMGNYDWTPHGVQSPQEQVGELSDEDILNVVNERDLPETAEEISNHSQSYESVEFQEMEDVTAQEALDDVGINESIIKEYDNEFNFGDEGRSKIFDNNDKPITKPISMGAAKLAVRKFIAKLYNKNINIRVYKNVAALKRKAPKLYAQATASRSDKKPIPNNAAGYAYKTSGQAGQVLIFTDNIATTDQLNFTIAHEVIGHFGLGSIMPPSNFRKLLDDIYARDGHIRREADLLMEMRGLDKHEAIEEALADAAAHLDNSLIARIADAIKRFFHALGVKFDDDMTRYFLRHSRIYQRTGKTPDSSPYAVLREFKQMDSMAGRASATQFDHNNEPIRNMEGGGYRGMPNKFKRFLNSLTSKDKALSRAKNAGRTMGKLLENIQSFDNLALRSQPLRLLFKIMTMQKQRLEALKTELSEIMAWSNKSRRIEDGLRKVGIGLDIKDVDRAPTDEERRHSAIASVWRNRMKADKATDAKLEAAADIGKMSGGKMVIDREGGFKKNRAEAYMSREELNKGFTVQVIDDNGNPVYEKDANGNEVYYDKDGKVTTETKKDARGNEVHLGKRKKEMRPEALVDHKGKPFKISKRVFRLMEQQRLATDTIAAHVYVDKVNGMMEEHNAHFEQLQDTHDLDAAEVAVMKKVSKVYAELYNEGASVQGSGMEWKQASIKRAERFSHNVTRMFDGEAGKLKIADWEQHRDVDTMGAFLPPGSGTHEGRDRRGKKVQLENGTHHDVVKDVVAEALVIAKARANAKKNLDHTKIHVAIQNMYLMNTQVTNAELYAKRTIQAAYVPLRRDGKYQVKMQGFIRSVDADGNEVLTPVTLPDLIQAELYYTRMDSAEDAAAKAKEIHDIMVGKDPIAMQLPGDPIDKTTQVVFRATWSTAEQGASLSGSISYDDLANTLIRAGVQINPRDRQKLVQLTASEHSTARSNLQKDWTPGYDPNIQHRVAEHLEQQAHIASKNRHMHKISRLMISEARHWQGDTKLLNDLQKEFLRIKKLGNEAATGIAFEEMARFQWRHISSADPTGSGIPNIKMYARDGSYKMVMGHGKGLQYKEKAKHIISGYHRQEGTPATGDEAFANQGSWAMSGTALFHLGGALAPALVNMTALETHTAFYLATLNSKTGYGGGHGYAAAFAAIHQAGSDMSLFKDGFTDMTGSAANIQKTIDNGTWKKYFRDIEEAEFMRDLTAEGATTPNLFNALSDVARSGHADSATTKVAEKWMIMFAKSEQFNRRVTALASYRLDKARMQEANGTETLTSKQKATLHQRATDAVNYSQGNYDSFNRPSWAQGNVFKYMWMYKQFQVITVQLMRNLGKREQAMMIGMLIFLSGFKGVPFMDDLWDFIDTLMQKFGIKWAGVEAEMTMLLKDSPIPSALVARGFVDHYLGFTGSNRFSLGDLIPGTGMLKAGADLGRETESIFGPVYGAWKGAALSAATATQYVAEVVGLKDDVTSLSDVLKTGGGFSALKNYMRGVTYMMDGAITNDRGQVVAKDAGAWAAITQLVGFYPAAATDQYAVIRMTNDARNYAQAIKTAYVDAALKAGSTKEANAIKGMVRDWNKEAKGTMFYIKDFSGALSKARKASKLNSAGRNLKTVPKAMKKFGKGLMESRGLDAKGIPLND
jgi:hypothetical protein